MRKRAKKEIGGKPGNFIFQAGILAAAGIVVRIIGILYRSPLVAIIGDEGNGYYNTAYAIYTIILLVSSYSIPSAISKVIAARLSLGEYRNAYRLFIGSIVYVVIVGGIGSIVCGVFADRLVGASSAEVLKIFAPTIFFSGLLGSLRGFFQAHHTMVYTSFSQILEQIFNAAVSIGAAYIFVKMLSGHDATTIAIGGAKGSAIGTGAGVLASLVFMCLVYISNKSLIKKHLEQDKTPAIKIMNSIDVAMSIIGMVTPVVLSTCIYNLSSVVNLKIYQGIVINSGGYSEALATTNYGLFSGKAMQIINIPIAIATAVSSAIIPAIANSHERGEKDGEHYKIAHAMRVTMLIAIPSAVGLFVLSEPITILLYPQKASYVMVSHLIKALGIAVIFYCVSTLSNAILQGTGNVGVPVRNASIALVVQTGVLVLFLKVTKFDLYALCLAAVTYSLLMCVLNSIAIKNRLGYIQEYRNTFLMPFIASVVMGLCAWGCNALITHLLHEKNGSVDMIRGFDNLLRLVVSIVVAVIVYGILMFGLGIISEDEITSMPGGRKIAPILKRCRLLR